MALSELIPLHKGSLIHLQIDDEWLGSDDFRLDNISRWMRENKALFKWKRVLDIGSNCGHFPVIYEELGAFVTAIEPHSKNLKVFREVSERLKSNISIIGKSLREVDYLAFGQIDVLSTIGLIYHLENPWQIMKKIIESINPSLWLVESALWEATNTKYESASSKIFSSASLSYHDENVLHPCLDEVKRGIRECGFVPEVIDLGPTYKSEDGRKRVFLKCYVADPHP